MERFLERVSFSKHRQHIIIKGGVLIASIIGIDQRSTLDLDSSLKYMDLSKDKVTQIVNEVIDIDLEDNIEFKIKSVNIIMDELEYPGIRLSLEARLDRMRTPLKLDFSVGDVITPKEIEYDYPLMFEDRSISILAYNFETVMAEKFETIISRGLLNTRMRDFYDIHMLLNGDIQLNKNSLKDSIFATFTNRGTSMSKEEIILILEELANDIAMKQLWSSYQQKFDYATNIYWQNIIDSVNQLANYVED